MNCYKNFIPIRIKVSELQRIKMHDIRTIEIIILHDNFKLKVCE